MSRNLLYYHYVFATKKRQALLLPERERELFAYIMGITNNLGGTLIRINAALNHVHILVRLPTTITTSEYIATVKRASSIHIKRTSLFPKFWGWAREYSVQSVSPNDVLRTKNYIAGQKEHHRITTFEDEWLTMLTEEERKQWKMEYFDK